MDYTHQIVENILHAIEKDLAFEIVHYTQEKKLTKLQAHEVAKDFRGLFQLEDIDILMDKMYEISQKHNIFKQIYINYVSVYNEGKRAQKLFFASSYIQQKKYDAALDILKGKIYE